MAMNNFKTVLMLVFVVTFMLWMFGEIAIFNCNAQIVIKQPLDVVIYIHNLIVSLFSPCSAVPIWLIILIIIPIAIILLLWVVDYVRGFIPFVG